MNDKVKVILIEDSGLMRILISEIIRSDSQLSLVATAVNGKEGIDKINSLHPDVVVTDMVMPSYDGLYVVKEVMKGARCPVILLSSLDRDDDVVFEALSAGAFDFIAKPRENNRLQYGLNTLIHTASQAGRIKQQARSQNFNPHTFSDELIYDLIVIGSSTGGPGAIEEILDNLPRNLAVPVVVVQHMPEHFIKTFAERLNGKKLLQVKVAEEGEVLSKETMYLAPGHANLRVVRDEENRYVFEYTNQHYTEFNFPSVDCLFESVAKCAGKKSLGVILTGMGRDGTIGMQKMRKAGAFTISQDESTSVVFGMPKSAQEVGAVMQVLKLSEIPGYIVSSLS